MLLLVRFVLHVVLLVVVLVLLVLLLLLLPAPALARVRARAPAARAAAAKNHRTSENRWPIIHLIRMSFYIAFLTVIFFPPPRNSFREKSLPV